MPSIAVMADILGQTVSDGDLSPTARLGKSAALPWSREWLIVGLAILGIGLSGCALALEASTPVSAAGMAGISRVLCIASFVASSLALVLLWTTRARSEPVSNAVVERLHAVMRKLGAEAAPRLTSAAEPLYELSAIIDELEPGIDRLIEQRQQREREVMRADQLAMVGQVAAGFAHEIRNPLTAVKMLVQTGRKEDGTPLSNEDLEVIEHEIRRMERSLQRFLDFARPPRPERRPLDLRLVVGRVLTLMQTRATRQSVAFAYRRPDLPIIVEADEDQIQQLILNLVMNALDAMPSGGSLECCIEQTPQDFLELRVSDSGPGIPVELLPRLFDPFISTKETGIGLGLAVSFRIAENHGGNLSAENLPDGGARFIVRLPNASHRESLAVALRTQDAE